MTRYYRPILMRNPVRPPQALSLGGGAYWFDQVEVMSREHMPYLAPVNELPDEWYDSLTKPRPSILGMDFNEPHVMGILNVTPDSFSDGGQYSAIDDAVAQATAMAQSGASLIDIGGESTRPGAHEVEIELEIKRTQPVVERLVSQIDVPISIDTRKTKVAYENVQVGAQLVNDVSGFTFDPSLASFCAKADVPVCVMHAQGTPQTMQDNPKYGNVCLDVFDSLRKKIDYLVSCGVEFGKIIADPGIGFGKTLDHNLQLLNRIGLFHGLGVPILLGTSRKGFIKTIGKVDDPQKRTPGSIASALFARNQGVQLFRVHDVSETVQALRLWQSIEIGVHDGT